MSWYSQIYTAVREYRKLHPISGWILTRLLNVLLCCQLCGLFLSFYIFIFLTCGYYVTSVAQATVYLIVGSFFFVMSIWSLMRTLFAPVERVPLNYRPSRALDERLKAVTPLEGSKYVVEKSTPQQIIEQNRILDEMMTSCGVQLAECDQLGRIKYCYECGHLKPDRCRHCSSCGSCCVKYDHHCPWINKCVTNSNYKFFLLYVVYTTIFIYFFVLTSIEPIVRYFISEQKYENLSHILLYSFTFLPGMIFGYYPLGELIIFHWQLVSLNETTVEQTKPAVLRFDNLADYNMGKWQNFEHVFGWGLWWLPVYTNMSDGLHFDIRYVSQNTKFRFMKVSEDSRTPSTEME